MQPNEEYDLILEEKLDHVVRLTFNRPDRRNPLSFAVAQDLVERLRRIEADEQVRAVILAGTGKGFCVGGDQSDFSKSFNQPVHKLLDEYPPLEVFRLVSSYSKPLIVAVNGAAMGGGFGLACAGHITIAAESARFGLPEIKIGTFPATVLPLVLPAIGQRRALELSMTGRIMNAPEAQEIGVVTEVVADDALANRALDLANLVASYSPVAMSIGLSSFHKSLDMTSNEALAYLNAMRAISFSTDDLHEGSTAFLEKRAPVWKGR